VLAYTLGVFCLTAGLRFLMRVLWNTLGYGNGGTHKTALLGANAWTELAILALQRDLLPGFRPVVVFTFDPAMNGTRFCGLPVRFIENEPFNLARRFCIDTIVVSPPITERERKLVADCYAADLTVQELRLTLSPSRQHTVAAQSALVANTQEQDRTPNDQVKSAVSAR
jgi:FlaA1/EpsC-like NDP-sugar epimerase